MKSSKKRGISNLFPIWLEVIFILLLIALIAFGYYIDNVGFIGDLLGEAAGIIVGIAVGLFIVQKYVETREREQWAKVRDITYSALSLQLRMIFIHALYAFTDEYTDDDLRLINQLYQPTSVTVDVMQEILALVGTIENNLREAAVCEGERLLMDYNERYGKFSQWVRPNLEQIRNILVPRLLRYSKDQQLVDKLILFDQVIFQGQELTDEVSRLISFGVGPHVLFGEFGYLTSVFLEVTRDLYAGLCEVWTPAVAR